VFDSEHYEYTKSMSSLSSGELPARLTALTENIASVFHGKSDVVTLALTAFLADGHVLLEDVPGVGKTLLAKAISKSLDCEFKRIQFTPDLLPADLLGTSIFNRQTDQFTFHAGPVFTQILLADEINRATPRTQSSLLEAMSEKQVTIDGTTRPLGPPFFVLATQNPYEFEGTYPLPESQLDRFTIRINVGYPPREAERTILTQHRSGEPVDQLKPVIGPKDIATLQTMTREVKVTPTIAEYLLNIVQATREHPDVSLGTSTRGALAYYRAVQARAVIAGRDYVTPDDVKELAIPVLAHRLMTRAWDQGGRDDSGPIIKDILAKVRVPV
jgi:MoxR-like ATPase